MPLQWTKHGEVTSPHYEYITASCVLEPRLIHPPLKHPVSTRLHPYLHCGSSRATLKKKLGPWKTSFWDQLYNWFSPTQTGGAFNLLVYVWAAQIETFLQKMKGIFWLFCIIFSYNFISHVHLQFDHFNKILLEPLLKVALVTKNLDFSLSLPSFTFSSL